MNEAVLTVLKSHFGADKVFEDSTNIIDDLGGDEFDVVDIIIQIEEKLSISIPEEETFDIVTVSALNEVVEKHVQST
jgi:acyl carrier protein